MTLISKINETDAIGEIIPWLDDETLFSWCTRYHHLTVNGTPQATIAQLFGRATIRCVHDFPTHISALVKRAGGSLGSVEEIIRYHTILPFYLTFKSREVSDNAIRAVSDSGPASLKYKLGLLTSGLGAAHPLKACQLCMIADLSIHQTPYWRLAHQLPGVWICPKHSVFLHIQSRDLRPSRRFEWMLPSRVGFAETALLSSTTSNANVTLSIRMAEYSLHIHSEAAARFSDAKCIARAFRLRMSDHGWLTTGGSVRWKAFSVELAAFVEQSAQIPQFSISTTPQLGQAQLAQIISGRALTHPLRYLLWICFIFDRWEHFIDAYEACREAPILTSESLNIPKGSNDAAAAAHPGKITAIEMLKSGSRSLTATATALRVCPSTVASWAAKAGMTTARRPKKLKDDVYSRAKDLLERGADKKEVCHQCAISIATVTRILRNVPGLQAQWHLIRHEKARANARATWALLIASHKRIGTAARRAMVPKIYAWLYRNDLTWLRSLDGLQTRPKSDNRARMRMQQADERHAKLLGDWLNSRVGNTNQLDQLGDLISAVPALRKIALAPLDWPLTIAVIENFMVTVPSNWEGSQTHTSQLKLL